MTPTLIVLGLLALGVGIVVLHRHVDRQDVIATMRRRSHHRRMQPTRRLERPGHARRPTARTEATRRSARRDPVRNAPSDGGQIAALVGLLATLALWLIVLGRRARLRELVPTVGGRPQGPARCRDGGERRRRKRRTEQRGPWG